MTIVSSELVFSPAAEGMVGLLWFGESEEYSSIGELYYL
jgi:hypothetical protein